MEIINLTGHDLTLTDRLNIVKVPSHGPRARMVSEGLIINRIEVEGLNDLLPLSLLTRREIIALPDPVMDTIYVTSGLVAAYTPRLDVVAPGRIWRDPVSNRVVGCQGFVKAIDPNGLELGKEE